MVPELDHGSERCAGLQRGKPDLESGKFTQRSNESKSMLRELFYTDTGECHRSAAVSNI